MSLLEPKKSSPLPIQAVVCKLDLWALQRSSLQTTWTKAKQKGGNFSLAVEILYEAENGASRVNMGKFLGWSSVKWGCISWSAPALPTPCPCCPGPYSTTKHNVHRGISLKFYILVQTKAMVFIFSNWMQCSRLNNAWGMFGFLVNTF